MTTNIFSDFSKDKAKDQEIFDDLDLMFLEEESNLNNKDIDDFILFGREKKLAKETGSLYIQDTPSEIYKIINIESSLFLYLYIGLCFLFLIAGMLVFQNLYKKNKTLQAPTMQLSLKNDAGVGQTGAGAVTQKLIPRDKMVLLSLEPFLISAQQDGSPVFLRINKVELLVKDESVRDGVLKKKGWVRDAIYTELKGMELPGNFDNKFLQQFNAALISQVNNEIAPLKVEDINLEGYLLK